MTVMRFAGILAVIFLFFLLFFPGNKPISYLNQKIEYGTNILTSKLRTFKDTSFFRFMRNLKFIFDPRRVSFIPSEANKVIKEFNRDFEKAKTIEDLYKLNQIEKELEKALGKDIEKIDRSKLHPRVKRIIKKLEKRKKELRKEK